MQSNGRSVAAAAIRLSTANPTRNDGSGSDAAAKGDVQRLALRLRELVEVL
jgi:hypothetical protein